MGAFEVLDRHCHSLGVLRVRAKYEADVGRTSAHFEGECRLGDKLARTRPKVAAAEQTLCGRVEHQPCEPLVAAE